MEKNKSIILVVILVVVFISSVYIIQNMFWVSEDNKVSNVEKQTNEYKFYEFISNNSVDCDRMKYVYKKLEKKYGDRVDFKVINMSEDTSISNKYKVRVTPTFLLLDKYGNVVKRTNGIIEYEQLSDMIAKVITK